MSTFDLLHKKVQEYIYRERWESFRPIQDEAIKYITTSSANLLICAPTASGKTEAAFLPIVSTIADSFNGSFRAIYVSPLKALINDQFKRINLLCSEIGIPVTKWHGDADQSAKTKALKNPSGILLITPESLEAILLSKQALARQAFKELQYIVIDEIHSFVGTERGAQLYSLLNRIEKLAQCNPVRIALSATVGNPESVGKWLSNEKTFNIVRDDSWDDAVGIQGIIRGFTSRVPEVDEGDQQEEDLTDQSFYRSIQESFTSGKNLIFGNSKRKLEETAYIVKMINEKNNSSAEFLIHHGSLSKYTRETAEEEIKNSSGGVSIFCTSTLEMGIDIGAIEKVGIIDPPWSVSGFAQRVGRSGRRQGIPRKFEFFILQEELNERSNISEILREDIVKSIAIVLLYKDGFKEPLNIESKHLSTLIHQLLAFCVQNSGSTLETLKKVILSSSFKDCLDESQFEDLLTHLVNRRFLHQEQSGIYSAGSIGEKIVEHYEFYSVFLTSDQWTVIHSGQMIGEIPVIGMYAEGDHLLLGGRVWLVTEIIEGSKRLIVVPAKNARAPVFNAAFGITHPAIHKKMLEVYNSQNQYKFLDTKSLELLSEAREAYKNLLTPNQITSTYYPIFEGTAVQNTISCVLEVLKIQHGISEIALEVRSGSPNWINDVAEMLSATGSATALIQNLPKERKLIQKYDHFLPDELLNASYASTYIDLTGAKAWIDTLKKDRSKAS